MEVAHTDGGTARAADANSKVFKKPEELVSHHEFLCLPWAVLFSMMKGYVSILITRHFLSRASGEQRSRLWNSIITICTKFLRNYLHLAQLPAFSPYHWFCPGKIQPLQECMIILAYMKESPQDESKHMLSYLLDEVFDLFGTGETLANKATLSLRPKEGSKAAWEVLQSLREEVTSRKGSPLERDISPLANRGEFGGGFGQLGAQSLEGHFHDLNTSGGQFLSCPQDEDDSWLDVLDYTA